VRAELTQAAIRWYWLQRGAFPAACFLLCMPILLLAIGHRCLTEQGESLVSHWFDQRTKQVVSVTNNRPTQYSDRQFLWNQFVVFSRVFKRGFRLEKVDWRPPVLTIKGQAASVLSFSNGWEAWRDKSKLSTQHVTSYRVKSHIFFEVSLTRNRRES
jgi:hypothetical protein